ncbi:MAG: (2Fe-2S)-binding protein [Alicyclobacillus sp.]|nr:(2Fe-2S)-binding protein [Alicyclobacillus sp.]
MAQIYFKTSGKRIEIGPEGEAHILRSSIRYGAGLPYRCAGGRCGTCKLFVESGMENLSPVRKAEERMLGPLIEQGYRLGCQTYARGDCTVSWTPAPAGTREYAKLRAFWERADLSERTLAHRK